MRSTLSNPGSIINEMNSEPERQQLDFDDGVELAGIAGLCL